MASKVRLICGNCGRVEKFESYHAAYEQSWDTPDRFGYTACDRCLGVSVMFPALALQEARGYEDMGDHEGAKAKRDEAAAQTLQFEPPGGSAAAEDVLAAVFIFVYKGGVETTTRSGDRLKALADQFAGTSEYTAEHYARALAIVGEDS